MSAEPLFAPILSDETVPAGSRQQFVDLGPFLTQYHWDNGERGKFAPTKVHDYRLRWKVRLSGGCATGTLEVWDPGTLRWNGVWETETREVVSTYRDDVYARIESWQTVLDELARKGSVVLLGIREPE